MMVRVVSIATECPPFSRKTPDILPLVDLWLEGEDERFIRKVRKIFEGAGVDQRFSIMPPAEVFTATSFEDKNRIYAREMIVLGKNVLQKALEKSGWEPDTLDFIITVSCTGIMIPSLDAYLINEIQLRQDIVRLPVTEMGCAAGVSGLVYARNFLRANPGKRAAVVAVESPTATFQLHDKSMANVVSAAIFGDGAACALVSSNQNDEGPEIVGDGMYHFFDAAHMMGFEVTNRGLQMVLDVSVPETIEAHFPLIIGPFLERFGLSVAEIDHLIFHPGGKKIIQTVQALFEGIGKNLDDTAEILRRYGNMSSATVLYVLERVMSRQPAAGDYGLMLSFGPGFSAQRILLRW
jgi:predicted naringenin-chalcone synthase